KFLCEIAAPLQELQIRRTSPMRLSGKGHRQKRANPVEAVRPASQPNSTLLLAWYDRHRRALPWRAAHGEASHPYRGWLSEIMLQQTSVRTVAPYYARFLERWPTIEDLAASTLDDVLKLWAGLGYYARARNLHACARAVVEGHGGRFPDRLDELEALPGVGA